MEFTVNQLRDLQLETVLYYGHWQVLVPASDHVAHDVRHPLDPNMENGYSRCSIS